MQTLKLLFLVMNKYNFNTLSIYRCCYLAAFCWAGIWFWPHQKTGYTGHVCVTELWKMHQSTLIAMQFCFLLTICISFLQPGHPACCDLWAEVNFLCVWHWSSIHVHVLPQMPWELIKLIPFWYNCLCIYIGFGRE